MKLVRLSSLWVSVLAAGLFSFQAIAAPGEGEDVARITDPSVTDRIVQIQQDYDRLDDAGKAALGYPREFQNLLKNIPKDVRDLSDRIDKLPEGSEQRRELEEERHTKLWGSLPENVVREAMGVSGDGKSPVSDGIRAFGAAHENAQQYRVAAEHFEDAVHNAHDRLTLAQAGDQFMDKNSAVKFPSVAADVQALIRRVPPPSQQAVRAYRNALNDAYSAITTGVEGKPKLGPDQVASVKKIMDYMLYTEDPTHLQYSADVLASIIAGNGTEDAVRGKLALVGASVDAVRAKLTEWAKQSGVWNDLVAEAKEALKKAGIENPSEKQIEEAISLQAMRDRVKEKLGNSELAGKFKEDMDKTHKETIEKTWAKLLNEEPSRIKAGQELVDKSRRPPCLEKGLMDIIASPTFVVGVLAASGLAAGGAAYLQRQHVLGVMHCNAAGKADDQCPGWKAPVHEVQQDMAPPKAAQPTGGDHDAPATLPE